MVATGLAVVFLDYFCPLDQLPNIQVNLFLGDLQSSLLFYSRLEREFNPTQLHLRGVLVLSEAMVDPFPRLQHLGLQQLHLLSELLL